MYSNNINNLIKEFYVLTDYNNPYNNLNKSREKQQKVVDLLEHFLNEKDLPEELVIFAYWNISDNYALQRKNENTYLNHLKFENYLKNKDYQYKLMLLVDTTQRLSIIQSGHGKYWDKLYYDYMNSIELNYSNHIIYFNVLRTATYNHELNTNINLIKDALNKMKIVISRFSQSKVIKWFKLNYYNSLIAYNYKNNIEDNSILDECFNIVLELVPHLMVENQEKELANIHKKRPLIGSFDDWNKEIDLYQQARYIQNIIITLINTNHFELAKKCYELINSDEFTSPYFRNKIALLYNK